MACQQAPADDERQLIEQAKHDRTALAQLYRQHYSAIAAYVQRRVADRHEADDIIAEVFVAMVKNLPRYRCRGVPFRIWLFRIATSQISRWARSRHRRARNQLRSFDVAHMSAPSPPSTDIELVELVLATLPTRLQNVLSLHYLEGLKIAEIAAIVRCSEGTVKSRLHDGRVLMRSRLEKRGFRND